MKLDLASSKIYVDLTDAEEKKAKILSENCQNIIDIIKTIKTGEQDAQEFINKLDIIITKIQIISRFGPQIRNLKSTIETML